MHIQKEQRAEELSKREARKIEQLSTDARQSIYHDVADYLYARTPPEQSFSISYQHIVMIVNALVELGHIR